jgi:hypothetical protein
MNTAEPLRLYTSGKMLLAERSCCPMFSSLVYLQTGCSHHHRIEIVMHITVPSAKWLWQSEQLVDLLHTKATPFHWIQWATFIIASSKSYQSTNFCVSLYCSKYVKDMVDITWDTRHALCASPAVCYKDDFHVTSTYYCCFATWELRLGPHKRTKCVRCNACDIWQLRYTWKRVERRQSRLKLLWIQLPDVTKCVTTDAFCARLLWSVLRLLLRLGTHMQFLVGRLKVALSDYHRIIREPAHMQLPGRPTF